MSANWVSDSVEIVSRGEAADPGRTRTWPALTSIYKTASGEFALTVTVDSRAGYAYLVPGGPTLLAVVGDDMVYVALGSGPIHIVPSMSRISVKSGDLAAAVAPLVASVSDSQLLERAGSRAGVRLDLRTDPQVPVRFFARDSSLSSEGAVPAIVGVDLRGSELTLHLESDGRRFRGTFVVDLARPRVVSSSVEGDRSLPIPGR
jgi:hypothetical protein